MDPRCRRFWFLTAAAIAVGILVRLWFVLELPRIAGDTFIYGGIAKNLLLHHIYGFEQIPATFIHPIASVRPTLIRLPGYPLFLALCFHLFGMEHYNAVLFLQIVIDLFTCLLVATLAARLFGRRAFLPVLWLAALCPFTANYVAAPLTETLVLFTIALAFYSLHCWRAAGLGYNRWLWILAAAISYSLLLRPDQGLLAAAIFPAMLWMSIQSTGRRTLNPRALAPILVAAVCILLPFVPWAIRNWRAFHVVQPLVPRYATDPGEPSPIGFARWYSTWGVDYASTEGVFWSYDTEPIELSTIPNRAFSLGCLPTSAPRESLPLYASTAALLDEYNVEANATPAIDARFAQLARTRIAAAPLCDHVALPVVRLLDMLLRPRIAIMNSQPLTWWKWSQHPGETAFAAAYATLNLGYFVLAIAGFLVWKRRAWLASREIAWSMLAFILLRCALLLTLDNPESRYTLEFFPILFVCIGALFASPSRQCSPNLHP